MVRKNPLNKIKPTRIIYPVLFGLGVVTFMFIRNFNPQILDIIDFNLKTYIWISIALCLMVFRDIGYIIRIKILSDNELSWIKAIRIILLWEFTSAITPSAIGGTSVAILYVNKEDLGIGKSSAIVMATSFLDELYFILTFPILLLILKTNRLFIIDNGTSANIFHINEFFLFAILGYGIKLIFTVILSYGLFFNPRGLKWILLWIFKLPVLRRWRQGANEAGSEIIQSSTELRQKPFSFWIKAFGATAFSWTSRYWVVNALFLAFFTVPDHFLIYARQLVTWIMMLVSPTPGGSGFSEYVFIRYFGEFIQTVPELKNSFASILAFLWRLISYYPYLLIGVFLFPKWIKMKFGSNTPD